MGVQIIAEIGENHLGDVEIAKKLIDVAAQSGAGFAKFQLYDAEKTHPSDPEKEWFRKVQLSDENFKMLVEYCRKRKIKPLCTPWEIKKATLIFDAGLEEIKIASFHIADHELLSFISQRAKVVFLSTGMSEFHEIRNALEILKKVPQVFLLHCVSEYPVSIENVNLRVIQTLKNQFKKPVGYSDHSIGILACIAAVALGAEVIEKHITLSKELPGTDHILSADPKELKEMVAQIRKIEIMLGTGEKKLTALERKNQEFLRKRFTW